MDGLDTPPAPASAEDVTAVERGSALARIALYLVVVIAALVTFLPVIRHGLIGGGFSGGGFTGHGFAGLGDGFLLLGHDHWHGLNTGRLEWMLSTHRGGTWRPLAWMSLGLDAATAGTPSPAAVHRTALALHTLSAGLVALLLRRVVERFAPAARAPTTLAVAIAFTLAWALHPLRVESVAWASVRGELLGATLALGGAVLIWDAATGAACARLRVAGASVLGFLAALADPALVAAAPALILLALVARRGPTRTAPDGPDTDTDSDADTEPGDAGEILSPLAGLAIVLTLGLPAVAVFSHALSGFPTLRADASAAAVLFDIAGATADLVRATLLPTNLHPVHDAGRVAAERAATGWMDAAAVALAVVGACSSRALRRSLAPALGVTLLLVTASRFLGAQATPVEAFGADRLSYLATLPAFAVLAVLIARLPRGTALASAAGAAVLAAGLGVASREQLTAWSDTDALLAQIERSDRSNETALAFRIAQLRTTSESRAAVEGQLQRALKKYDGSRALLQLELGRTLMDRGALDEALPHLRRAVELAPRHFGARAALGSLYLLSGQAVGAEPAFYIATIIDPESAAAWFGLGRARAETRNRTGAVSALERALELDPEHGSAETLLETLR